MATARAGPLIRMSEVEVAPDPPDPQAQDERLQWGHRLPLPSPAAKVSSGSI